MQKSYGRKKLSGERSLTVASVNTLQNAFGIAIRQTAAKQYLIDEQKVYQMEKKHKSCFTSLYRVSRQII